MLLNKNEKSKNWLSYMSLLVQCRGISTVVANFISLDIV